MMGTSGGFALSISNIENSSTFTLDGNGLELLPPGSFSQKKMARLGYFLRLEVAESLGVP